MPPSDVTPETLAAISLAAEAQQSPRSQASPHSLRTIHPLTHEQAHQQQALVRQLEAAGPLLAQMASEGVVDIIKTKKGWRLPINGINGEDVVLTPEGAVMIVPTPGAGAFFAGALAAIPVLGASIALMPSAGNLQSLGPVLFILQALATAVASAFLATAFGFAVGYFVFHADKYLSRAEPTRPVTIESPEVGLVQGDLSPASAHTIIEMARSGMARLDVPLPSVLAL